MSLKIFTSLALHALRGAIVWFDQRSDVIGLFFFLRSWLHVVLWIDCRGAGGQAEAAVRS